jgi:hypothetical protein
LLNYSVGYDSAMDAEQLRAILGRIGWSQWELSRRSGRTPVACRRMASGKEPISEPLAAWLRKLDATRDPYAFIDVAASPPPLPHYQPGAASGDA